MLLFVVVFFLVVVVVAAALLCYILLLCEEMFGDKFGESGIPESTVNSLITVCYCFLFFCFFCLFFCCCFALLVLLFAEMCQCRRERDFRSYCKIFYNVCGIFRCYFVCGRGW